MNSNQKILVIAGVTVLLAFGAFFWIVVLNKGLLSITAEAPFEVVAEGSAVKVPITERCAKNPCALRLPSGTYKITFKKEDHYDEVQSILIQRGQLSELTVEFEHVATLTPLGSIEDFDLNEDALETFFHFELFEFNENYRKQRLVYTDPDTQEETVWAYFDRPLENPLLFPHPTLKGALVVDRANIEASLYWIDGVHFKRSYVGKLADVNGVEWAPWSEDGPLAFVRTVASRSGEIHSWMVNVQKPEIIEWPLTVELSHMLWIDENTFAFATSQNMEGLLTADPTSSLDAVKALLGAMDNETTSFSLATYHVPTATYRTLYEVSESLGIQLKDVIFFKEEGRLLLTDGVTAYELAQ